MLNQKFSLLDDFPPASYEQWREVVDKDLKGAPFDKKLITHTYEGIDIHPVYTRRDWSAQGNPSGFSGVSPFTRGMNPLGNSVCGWDIRQEVLDPDIERANKSILEDLQRGVLSIQLRFDVAARNGEDPSDANPQFTGRDGMPLYCRKFLARAMKDVHVDAICVALEAGAAFLPAAAMLTAYYNERGVDLKRARAAFNADPLAVYVRDGKLPVPVDVAMQQMADLAVWTSKNMPGATSVRVGTGPYHHAGATAAQDVAFSMATAVAYLRKLTDAGLSIDAAAKQLLFNFNIGTNQFLAIAKLRAARKLYARILEASGASSETAGGMNMHVRTSKRVITARDPWVNILRNTVTTFAAAVAGAQVVTTEPYDKALGVPDNFARRIARNTQVILMEESHLNRVIDPAGGCWFLESLTDQVAEKAYAIFREIESKGGMQAVIESGWARESIDSAFTARLKNISTRKDAVTGVSEFPNLGEKLPEKKTPDYATMHKTVVEHMRDCKCDEKTQTAVKKLKDTAGVERVQALVEVFAGCATIGKVYNFLKGDAQPATEIAPITPSPYAQPFEELRDASDAYLALTGSRPKVFLANMGPIAHFTARATYSKNFFEAGGFEVVSDATGHQGASRDDNDGAAQKAVDAFGRSGANIAVICSSDVIYPAMVPLVAKKLKEAGARKVILAGFPAAEHKEAFEQAGVDQCIYMKCDVLGTLRQLLEEEGVLQAATA